MKKIIILILAFALLGVTGCSNSAEETASLGGPTLSESPAGPSATIPASPVPTLAQEEQPVSTEAESALAAYKTVLKNEASFYSTENEKDVLFDDFLTNEDIFVAVFTPEHFAILDMDGDTVPEIVIALQPADLFEVLHYREGEVEGYIFSNRQLGQLKVDGTFYWSGSASNWGVGKLDFYSAHDYRTDDLGYMDVKENNGEITPMYIIDDQSVTEDVYDFFIEKQDAKPDAAWYEFSKANIETAF